MKSALSAIVVIILIGVGYFFFGTSEDQVVIDGNDVDQQVACTLDAKICPDGSAVGRVGPDCEFAMCPEFEGTSYNDLIRVSDLREGDVIISPLVLEGEARGNWFFEASFPISIVNWDGLIIAEHYASAEGDWMTTEYVPYTSTVEFENPYKEGDPEFMKRGAIILHKDNASGLPEHDDALEIPIMFAE